MRLALLVAAMVLPLTLFAAVLSYHNYDAGRRTAYERILQIARTLAFTVDGELRSAIASLQVLALSEALDRNDLDAFRMQAEHFVTEQFAGSNVVLSDATGQQLLNTAVPTGVPLPKYARLDVPRRIFATGRPEISDLLLGPVLRRNIVVVDVPVRRGGNVKFDLAASIPLDVFAGIVAQQRIEPDWTIAIFDRKGILIARSREPERFIGQQASPSLYPALTSSTEGVLDSTTFDGTVVLTGFSRARYSGWSVAVGAPRSALTGRLWRSVAVLAAFGILSLLLGIIIALKLATQLTRTQADRELLINELNHRVKNTFATVQAIVVRTLASAPSMEDAKRAAEDRIMALSRAHDVLTDEHWQGAELQELVHSICEPYRSTSPDRIELEICRQHINPRATVGLAMVFNELLTNAVKYGALSRPEGRVRIACRLMAEAQATLTIEWKETDGPRIDEPSRRGFGSALIEQTVKNELGGELLRVFNPDGLICTITVPLQRLR